MVMTTINNLSNDPLPQKVSFLLYFNHLHL